MKKCKSSLMVLCLLVFCGCAIGNLHSEKERRMTLGLVQREIKVGMSQADVAAALGSPNIVTRDKDGKESWIYDKIATEASYRDSKGNVSGSVAGTTFVADTLLLGMIGGSQSRSSGASATTQKTLTVIIRFNNEGLVDSFSYHSSTF
ncbi:MAG TPA: hypothetical protein PKY35_05680 [Candidatus Hydrogenedentes bacterium]|nr:hypothetical protein [Candidatus Hydrogenedentota bacterium]HOL76502.1 hypothetical protein [Candidatus Hydrogenedentota bacterium]HPO85167.1 hypothetical protein [Candidatus Hydrogenedentota bacterium]